MLHLLLDQVSFLNPTKVSGQHIPEGFIKETRVIVVIGAKGFLLEAWPHDMKGIQVNREGAKQLRHELDKHERHTSK